MVDKELMTAVRAAKSGKMHHFALVGKTELSVARNRVSAAVVKDMKAAAGGGSVVTGTCVGGEDALVFTTSKASPTLAAILKKCIKEKAGLTISCEVTAGDDDESEADADEDDEAAAAKAAAVRKKRMVAAFSDLLKANADKIKTSREAVAQARDLKAALDRDKLDEAEKLLTALGKTLA